MKRFEIRLSKELHEKLREESFITEKSMHEIVIELIEEHYNKKEGIYMNEVVKKAIEIMEGVYVQNLPQIKIGDVVKLGDVWDGQGNTPEESYSYQISETDWINYEFEIVEEKDNELETLVKITDIDLI